jgi:hypothetical protein
MQNTPQSGVREPQLLATPRPNDGYTTAPTVHASNSKPAQEPAASDQTALFALLQEMKTSIDAVHARLEAIEDRILKMEYEMVDVRHTAYAGATFGWANMSVLECLAGPLGRVNTVSEMKKETIDDVAESAQHRDAERAVLNISGLSEGSRGRVGQGI